MKELFSYLNEREKKRLSILGLLLLLALVFLLFFSFGERRSYFRELGRLQSRAKAYAEVEMALAESRREWTRWQEAHRDLEALKEARFFKEEDGFNQIRVDLQQVFAQSGINPHPIKYDYIDQAREKAKKVNLSFNFTGSYPALKAFLSVIESYPKFLLLEKIDFIKISVGGNILDLRIVLSAYYESY